MLFLFLLSFSLNSPARQVTVVLKHVILIVRIFRSDFYDFEYLCAGPSFRISQLPDKAEVPIVH